MNSRHQVRINNAETVETRMIGGGRTAPTARMATAATAKVGAWARITPGGNSSSGSDLAARAMPASATVTLPTNSHEVAAGEPDVAPMEFLRLSARYLRPYWLRQAEIFAYMLLSLAFTAEALQIRLPKQSSATDEKRRP